MDSAHACSPRLKTLGCIEFEALARHAPSSHFFPCFKEAYSGPRAVPSLQHRHTPLAPGAGTGPRPAPSAAAAVALPLPLSTLWTLRTPFGPSALRNYDASSVRLLSGQAINQPSDRHCKCTRRALHPHPPPPLHMHPARMAYRSSYRVQHLGPLFSLDLVPSPAAGARAVRQCPRSRVRRTPYPRPPPHLLTRWV